jgi:hypothetical protein
MMSGIRVASFSASRKDIGKGFALEESLKNLRHYV